MKEQQLGMEEKHEQRYTEMRVLILYTLYSVAMITAAVSLDWDRWIIPIILMAGAVAWGTYLKDYRTYRYRSFLVTVLAMMNFIIYGICAVDFLGMIPAMGVLAVMLAIYGVAENIYIVMLCSALVLLYHMICVGDISIKPTTLQNCRQMIELISAFVIEYLAFYLVCKQPELQPCHGCGNCFWKCSCDRFRTSFLWPWFNGIVCSRYGKAWLYSC